MTQYIYLYLVVALAILWVLQQSELIKKKELFLYSSGIVLAFVLALRNAEFGVIDMLRYSMYYDSMKYSQSFSDALFHSNGKDMGYWGLVYLFTSSGFSFQLFVSVVAVFDIAIFIYYVKKYSPDSLLSCFILLGTGSYTFLFYGLRQAIALPLVLLCVDACYRKKIIITVFFLVLAVLFHWSAVAIIPLLLVSKIRFSGIIVIGYAFAMILMLLFSVQIGYLITFLFREEYVDTYESSGSLGGLAILYLLLLFWYVIALKKRIGFSYKHTFFLHAFILLSMIQICSSYAYAFTRLNYYYMMAAMSIAVPMSFEKKELKLFSKRDYNFISIIGSSVIIFLMIRIFFSFISGNHLEDYVFLWEEVI